MTRYDHTQPGWPMLLAVSIPLTGIAVLALALGAPAVVPAMIAGIVAAVAACFPSLTVTIDDARVTVKYGLGMIRKTYVLSEILGARPVRNRWWYGWGIRLTPHGWMYNISGLDAVEVTLASGRTIRIGTDEPERLARALAAAAERAR